MTTASTLAARFLSMADRVGDQSAVIDPSGAAISYGELDEASNRLAVALTGAGVGPGDRVCLLIPKSSAAVTAMLAVNKLGATFTPLDEAAPGRRLAVIMKRCDSAVLIAASSQQATVELMAEALGDDAPRVVIVAAAGSERSDGPLNWQADVVCRPDEIERLAGSAVTRAGTAADQAYLLFTSGSTGVPKGVPIPNAAVVAFVDWANRYFDVRIGDRQSGHSPLHFDLSMHDIFGTLLAGAELHLVPPEANLLPTALIGFMADRELTQWFSVPSVLRAIEARDGLKGTELPALERLLWCGEVLPPATLRYWMERLPHVRFTNLYGPTEATIASSFHTVTSPPTQADNTPIPIGRPCTGEGLHVLDGMLDASPVDVPGDLYLSGAGLSAGYWRDEERTALAFVDHPKLGRLYRTGDLASIDADGIAHFLGRADRQIKSRGYRIELDEIATALAAVPDLQDSAVVAIESSGFEGSTICAAFVAAPDADPTPTRLRTRLSAQLPSYMLPARWLAVSSIPKTANGKIDHRQVVELFSPATHQARADA